jgi:flagellar motor switch protein FliG
MLVKDPAERLAANEVADALQSITAGHVAAKPLQPVGLNLAELAQQVSTDAGAGLLLAMPDDQAGRILRDIAVAGPSLAGGILRMLPTTRAAQILPQLSLQALAAILSAMLVSDAARVLSLAEAEDAARVITKLPGTLSAKLMMEMGTEQVAEIIVQIPPATIAAILSELSPARRAQVRSVAQGDSASDSSLHPEEEFNTVY